MNKKRKFLTDTYYSPKHTIYNNIEYIPINGHYISGFIVGDGCLSLHTGKIFGTMHLYITQHINNKILMENIATYFKSTFKVYSGHINDIQINIGGAKT